MRVKAILGFLLAALSVSIGYAQPFTYQGSLKESGVLANGNFDFRFLLWTQPTGGSQIGPELYVDAVPVQNGLFTVQLDFGSVWDGSDRYLEIRVRRVGSFGYWLLQPRVKINPTPYAAFALRPWQTAGSAVFYNAGNVGIGTNAPAARLSLGGDTANTKLALWQGGTAADVMGFGVAPDQFRLHLHRPSNRFSFLDAPAGSELVTILGNGKVGIGTSNPSYALQVVSSGGNLDRAISGHHTATTGIISYGVYGRSDSTFGRGVYGEVTAGGGSCIGVEGRCASGVGVYGSATDASSNFAFGGYFESSSTSGTGVAGRAAAASGTNYGVQGASNSPSGYGVYSFGNFAATGTKTFQIDHPLRPETHYLNHFCFEGPEPQNIYNGVVVLDARGEAWVQLPDYFESINRDPRYTLTPVGAPMPNLHVAVEIQGNRFKIAGGAPGKKVSWRVEAVRNDLWVQRHGFQTEQEKPEGHRGKYLHPELYGQPKERGIFYRPEPERPSEGEKPQ